ncbi:hypothetical protein BA720P3_00024 [Bifidobacterium phage BA720P3]|nr:hypothetical protein BA720P3_00024 [Bifidobacterium phage BA720P3]WAX05545.1 hypothetical protein BA746P1_00024 [Bifidobacterium phage BA746P1]
MSTDIIVALVTGLCAIVVAAVTWVQNRRGDLSEAYRRLSEAQLNMQREIDRQDEKITEFIQERDELRLQDDLKTSYIRAIGHWLGELCNVLDPEFLERYPKPRLPDELRGTIEPLKDDNSKEQNIVH